MSDVNRAHILQKNKQDFLAAFGRLLSMAPGIDGGFVSSISVEENGDVAVVHFRKDGKQPLRVNIACDSYIAAVHDITRALLP